MATPSSPPPTPLSTQVPPQDHHQPPPSPSSAPTPSDPSSPKPTPTLQSTSHLKKTQPLPWTHQETINLIQAYQEKWYSLKKGQLKASQWEEVAITVAARCGYDEPSKSATQCRHKIEKLRKRYRAEKLKPNPNSWQYFDLMDRMERGPLPISARPMAMIQYQNSESSESENEDSDDEEVNVNYSNDSMKNKSKSINHIVRGEPNINSSAMDPKLGGRSDRVLRVLRNPMVRRRKECFESDEGNDNDNDGDDDDNEEEDDEDEDKERVEEGGGSKVAVELAVEIRAFAERFVRMENKKIEMMRETERYRMEMENKRMEMILESQKKIVDTIGRAFSSHKKMKMAQEI